MTDLKSCIQTLEKFTQKGRFTLNRGGSLVASCNIPTNSELSGVYLFYNKIDNELLYIGISGTCQNGIFKHRKKGLRARLIKGKQFKGARNQTLLRQMEIEDIQELEIIWYVTYDNETKQIPKKYESMILQEFERLNGKLPRWNKVRSYYFDCNFKD